MKLFWMIVLSKGSVKIHVELLIFSLCDEWPYWFWCLQIMIMTTCSRDFWFLKYLLVHYLLCSETFWFSSHLGSCLILDLYQKLTLLPWVITINCDVDSFLLDKWHIWYTCTYPVFLCKILKYVEIVSYSLQNLFHILFLKWILCIFISNLINRYLHLKLFLWGAL